METHGEGKLAAEEVAVEKDGCLLPVVAVISPWGAEDKWNGWGWTVYLQRKSVVARYIEMSTSIALDS